MQMFTREEMAGTKVLNNTA